MNNERFPSTTQVRVPNRLTAAFLTAAAALGTAEIADAQMNKLPTAAQANVFQLPPTEQEFADAHGGMSRSEFTDYCEDGALGAVQGIGLTIKRDRKRVKWDLGVQGLDPRCPDVGHAAIVFWVKYKKNGKTHKRKSITVQTPTDDSYDEIIKKQKFSRKLPHTFSITNGGYAIWNPIEGDTERTKIAGLAYVRDPDMKN